MINFNYSSVYLKQCVFFVIEPEVLKWLQDNLEMHDCTFWVEPYRKGSLVTVDVFKANDAGQDWLATFLKSPNFLRPVRRIVRSFLVRV